MNKLKKIELYDLKDLYHHHIVEDFAIYERPPLFALKNHFKKQVMEGYLFIQNDLDTAYTINILSNQSIIISLFAVYKEYRNQGIGSLFLKDLIQVYDNKVIILEVEIPDKSKDDLERIKRVRRIKFYQANGFVLHEDISYKIFNVPMYLMTYCKEDLSKEQIIALTKETYSKALDKVLMKMVDIK